MSKRTTDLERADLLVEESGFAAAWNRPIRPGYVHSSSLRLRSSSSLPTVDDFKIRPQTGRSLSNRWPSIGRATSLVVSSRHTRAVVDDACGHSTAADASADDGDVDGARRRDQLFASF